MSTPLHILFSTCPAEHAERLVRVLLEERLIGCGNIVPGVRSLYHWNGGIESDEECVLLMESTPERVGEARRRLTELHPYDVPKIVVLDASEANELYVRWLRSEVGG